MRLHLTLVNRAISASSSSAVNSVDLRPPPGPFSAPSKNSIKVRPALAFAAAEAETSRRIALMASLTSSRSVLSEPSGALFSHPELGLEAFTAVVSAGGDAFAGDVPTWLAGVSRDRAAPASIPVTGLDAVSRCFPGGIA
jgi:hypothetical protein